ncbi:hypothetical protein HID58_041442 [Brassica napus]|uniref:STI1 domain-containing protein n=1 Tax=Brassica napus TaxID=3708 RepID=A0ABQ8BAV0_BRANA|nr:hypothetical protein HID58_041442 [Brassica napus]
MDATKLSELKLFIEQCKSDPSLLSTPSLSFFRDYLHSLGAKIPTAGNEEHKDSKARSFVVEEESDDDMEETEEEDEIVESDVELEGDTVEPDNDPPQKVMGDASVEVTDENREAAQEAKGKAMEALSEGNFDEAIEHLTQAITLNPASAIMYGNRASVYIKLKKPNAAIRDAYAALEVEPNAHKLEEHRRKYDRLRKERDDKKAARDRQRRRAEAQAAYDKAKKEEQSSSSRPSGGGFPGGMPSGFPGGMPGAGGFPGGMPGGFPEGKPGAGAGGMPGGVDFSKILNDPELMTAFSDPEVMAALQDVMKNPANLAKHQANPKVAPVIAKMMGKFGGAPK